MSIIQNTVQSIMKTAVGLAPDSWLPGSIPEGWVPRAKETVQPLVKTAALVCSWSGGTLGIAKAVPKFFAAVAP